MTGSMFSTDSTRAVIASALAFGLVAGAPGASAADTAAPKTCTVEGINLKRDASFISSLHPSDRERTFRETACEVESVQNLTAGDTTVRMTVGRLYNGKVGDPQLNVRLISIATIDRNGVREIGRVFLSPDPITGEMLFEPQVKAVDDGLLIRLSRRHMWVFRLQGTRLFAQTAFAWRGKLDPAFPDDARYGANLSIDLETMEGSIAVRSNGIEPGAKLPSAYDENRMLVARLAWRNGEFVAESSEILPRQPGKDMLLDTIGELDDTIRQGLKDIPAGTEPCSFGGWSNDTDPKGLNVRAAPNLQAKILGIVPPPRKLPKEFDAGGPDAVKAAFRVIGHRGGWFLIEDIRSQGVDYGSPYPRTLLPAYKGRGWINGRMVGAAYANGGLPAGRLYVSPHADAGSSEVIDKHGDRLGAGGSPSRILACSGWWALVETGEGTRGWWRALCSNQVTNCS